MKKLISIFCAAAMALLCAIPASAQQENPQLQPLPIAAEVRTGVLPNGLTYFIRHNETPKGQADFFIAQKVGSILENEEQRGLAHFLEHMCFNGTQNFPGNQLVKYLESVGVQFGVDLNAYTSIDETVYNISNVPTARQEVQDSCLIILHDWADGLLLDPEEIDKERGVIHEEWRQRNVGQQRILEKLLPTLYPDSKYGHRMPIGLIEVIDNFPPQAIRDYYETWYRPDQQGIIVVGDIDVDRIEAKIKEIFSPIQMPENAKPREYEEVPDTEGTIFAIGADPEQQYSIFEIDFKTEVLPRELRNTMAGMIQNYVTDMMATMLSSRFSEMVANPDAPFSQAWASYGNYIFASTEDSFSVGGVAKTGDMIPAFASVYRELLRAVRGGFTISEYDRARSEYLSRLEKAYNNRDKVENTAYAREIVRYFVDNEAMPGIETEYQMMQTYANAIPVEVINQALAQMVTDDNRVVLVMLPEKEEVTIPTEAQLAEVMQSVDAETIEPFVDEVKAEPLIPELPAPGKIVSEKSIEKWGATELTLSNGAKVVVKPTQFKADEILMDAQAIGGTSVFPDEYANTLIFLDVAVEQNSLGDYTAKDLQKYLQGKQVNLGVDLSDYTRDITGSTTPKDLPTMMELLYMTFTNFNYDASEFEALQKQLEGILANQETNPQYIFGRDLRKALYKNPRKEALSIDHVKGADREQTIEIVRKMTANAADYTFFFVGNIDMDTFRPLVEQYIATLPADAANVTAAPEFKADLHIQPGDKETGFKTPMQTPTTYVGVFELGKIPYSAKNRLVAMAAGDILSTRLLDTVREDMGAVYSIWATAGMSRIAFENNTTIQSSFPMKPEMRQQVFDFIAQELKNMESNVTSAELAKVVEIAVKDRKAAEEKNNELLNAMSGEAINGIDTFTDAIEIYQNMTVEDIQNFMKEMNAQGNYRVIFLEAEEAPATEEAAPAAE